jgi:hypothetical protein
MGHYLCDMRPELFESAVKENKMNKKNAVTTDATFIVPNGTRRWVVLRKSTGRLMRSFATREGARMFKRTHRGTTMYDTVRAVAAR